MIFVRMLLLALLLLPAARAQQLRRVELVDGRVVTGQVVEMTAVALVLDVPQGRTRLDLQQIASLAPVAPEDYETQPPWRIAILPFVSAAPDLADTSETAQKAVADTLGAVTHAGLVDREALGEQVGSASLASFEACGIDAACTLEVGRAAGLDVVVMGALDQHEGEVELLVASIFVRAPRAQRQVALSFPAGGDIPAEGLRDSVESALFLEPGSIGFTPLLAAAPTAPAEAPPPPPAVEPITEPPAAPGPAAPDTRRLARLCWVPLPGAPSLARRDPVGVLGAWAVTIPGSVAMVNVAGHAATTPEELALLGLLSTYAVTVAANRGFGLREVQVAAAPVEGGGATVNVAVTR